MAPDFDGWLLATILALVWAIAITLWIVGFREDSTGGGF